MDGAVAGEGEIQRNGDGLPLRRAGAVPGIPHRDSVLSALYSRMVSEDAAGKGGDLGGTFGRHYEAERVRTANRGCGHWWFTLLART